MRENKKLIIGFGVLLVVLAVFAYLYYAERQRQLQLDEISKRSLDAEASALQAQSSGTLNVQLHFYRPTAAGLETGQVVVEERSVFKTDDVALKARQIVGEVMKGAQKTELKLFPEKAKLKQVYLFKDGTAIVDLSRETTDQLVGGVTSELCALYSITRSLTANIDSIKRVKFLVDGEQRSSLAGHVSIGEAFM